MNDRALQLKELFKQLIDLENQIDELLGAEKIKNRPVNIKPIRVKPKHRGKKAGGQWSYKYDKCIDCGTTDHPHKTRGFCVGCYNLSRVKHYIATGEILPRKPHKKKDVNFDDVVKKRYKCENCERVFYSNEEYMDVNCPDCAGTRILKL